MSEETQKPYQVIDKFVARDIVTYTKTSVMIEHKVRVWVFVFACVFVLASPFMLVGSYASLFRYNLFKTLFLCWTGILWISGISLFINFRQRSYRYEFDKENQQIRCKWVGFQGIHRNQRKEITYPLGDLKYICVESSLDGSRSQPRFKLKAVLKNDQKIDLPSGASMHECLEDANKYRDFLEISAPLELPA